MLRPADDGGRQVPARYAGVAMILMSAQAWTAKYFDEASRPAEITVLRWLRDGKLSGRKVGGQWFVDEPAWLAAGDDLVHRVLEAGESMVMARPRSPARAGWPGNTYPNRPG